jgi:hypothetical protein
MNKTLMYPTTGRIDELKNIQPRKILAWVQSSYICFKCDVIFTWYIRKHHCRSCGRVFCSKCTDYWAILNDKYEKYPIETINEGYMNYKKRVCKKCFQRNKQIYKMWKLVKIFELVDITILDLLQMSRVCHIWHQLYIYYLSKFRDIQYHLPTHKLNNYEKNILWNNRHIFFFHNNYFLQFIKTFHTKKLFLKKKIKVSCHLLKCQKNCCAYLNHFQILDLLINTDIKNEKNESYFLICFKNITNEELYCLLLLIKKNKLKIEKQMKRLYDYILLRINTNVILKNEFDNSNNSETIQIIKNIGNLENMSKKDMLECVEIFDIFKNDTFEIKLFPNVKFKDIDYKNICVKKSNTRPVIIPFISIDDKIYKVLYKNGDVWKDKIIMNVIKLIDIILKKNNINLGIKTYDILPLKTKNNTNCGLIEIIENANTICDINMNKNFSIQNYIIEHNPNEKIEELRNKFIKSTAAYCIITYLLGIGDRHLDNIMITHDGVLFHIDFDYVLGDDPKISHSMIRITESMIDAMGGKKSLYFEKFLNYCKISYECLRHEYSIIMNMLSLLNNDKLESHIIKSFLPGQTTYEAEIEIIKHLDNNDTYSQKMYDLFHIYNKTF